MLVLTMELVLGQTSLDSFTQRTDVRLGLLESRQAAHASISGHEEISTRVTALEGHALNHYQTLAQIKGYGAGLGTILVLLNISMIVLSSRRSKHRAG